MLVGLSLYATLTHAQVPSLTRSSAFEYDTNTGQVLAEIIEPDDPEFCMRTEYAYDPYGNRRSVTVKPCAITATTSSFTARTSQTNYNSTNPYFGLALYSGQFPVSVTNALGHTETRQFDPITGQLLRQTGPNGLPTTWEYDQLGRVVRETRADGNSTRWEYALCTTVSGGTVDCSAYHRPALPGGLPTVIAGWAKQTPLALDGRANGPYRITYYDLFGRVAQETTQHPDGVRQIHAYTDYTLLGQTLRTAQTAANGSLRSTTYAYDAVGRLISTTRSSSQGNAISRIAYSGLTIRQINPNNQTRVLEKNPQGQLIRVTDELGNQIAYQYDMLGNLTKTRDPYGNTSTVEYNRRGFKVAINDPDMGRWTYRYNALGELLWQQSATKLANNTATTLQYDLLGRLIQKNQAEKLNYWYYDRYADGTVCANGIGKLCESATSQQYRRRIEYDTAGRPLRTRTDYGNVGKSFVASVSYDSHGRIDTQTWPTGLAIRNTYTVLGQLDKIQHASSGQLYWQAGGYDAAGQLTDFQQGNRITTHQVRDPHTGQLSAIQAGPGNFILNHSYQYDLLGNLTQRNDLNSNTQELFSYDARNRLTSHSLQAPSATRQHNYTYNALGNLLQVTSSDSSQTRNYLYPASGINSTQPHALSQVSGSVGNYLNPRYTYDANGNLATVSSSNGNTRSHFFNSANQPESLASSGANGNGGASAQFWYSADEQRIQSVFARNVNGQVKTRTLYQLHPDNAGGLYYELEIKEDGTLEHKHYLAGALLISRGEGLAASNILQTRYWHSDHLGSTAAITDENGNLVERLAYDPFGARRYPDGRIDLSNSLRSLTTERGFTGHEHLDDLGFVHMNGRVYDPNLGRFLSADPFIQYPDNLQSYNRYSYLFNNPLNGTDPSGYFNLRQELRNATRQVVPIAIGFVTIGWGGLAIYATLTSKNPVINALGQLGVMLGATVACGGNPLCGAVAGSSFAAGSTYYRTHNFDLAFEAGMASFTSAMLFYGAGQFGAASGSYAGYLAAHAAAGCASAMMQNQNCGRGAAAAALAKGVTLGMDSMLSGMDKQSWEYHAYNFSATVVAGGAAAQIAGGKFVNGAVTAAYGYIFNNMSSLRRAFYTGVRGFASMVADLATGDYRLVEPEVWGRTGSGERFRVDGVFVHAEDGRTVLGGAVVICEAKCGPTAQLSARQLRVYDAIAKNDFYLEGPKAGLVADRVGLDLTDGKLYIPDNRFGGTYLGVYEGSAAHLRPGAQKINWGAIFGGIFRGND